MRKENNGRRSFENRSAQCSFTGISGKEVEPWNSQGIAETGKERWEGAVILSTSIPPGGYYLPENEREVRQFIRTLENRADNTLGALKSARAYLEKAK